MYDEVQHQNGHLRVWDWPLAGRRYVIGVDPAEGVVRDRGTLNKKIAQDPIFGRDRPDYCAAVVIDEESAEHVATWHGYLEPFDFARSLFALGECYNTALMAIEINGPGYAVIQILARDLQYRRLFRSSRYGKLRFKDQEVEFGWRTDELLRPLLIAQIHALASASWTTRDPLLARQLGTMQYDENGKERAKGRDKDDLVFALAIALQARHESLSGTAMETPPEKPLHPDEAILARIAARRKRVRQPHGYGLGSVS